MADILKNTRHTGATMARNLGFQPTETEAITVVENNKLR